MIPQNYRGKEQMYFKHQLLSAYLERLFMIDGHHQRTICYVDCFAGPWQARDEALEDTSIATSLNIIRKCREGLLKFKHNVKFKAIFVEKDAAAYSRLKAYLENRAEPGIETISLNGEFLHQEPVRSTARRLLLQTVGRLGSRRQETVEKAERPAVAGADVGRGAGTAPVKLTIQGNYPKNYHSAIFVSESDPPLSILPLMRRTL